MQNFLRVSAKKVYVAFLFKSRTNKNNLLQALIFFPIRALVTFYLTKSLRCIATLKSSLFAPIPDEVKISDINLKLLYIVAEKDIEKFSKTLQRSLANLNNFHISSISVVVPEEVLIRVSEIVSATNLDLRIVNENDLVSSDNRRILRSKFGNRYGWALQQFLKIESVIQEDSIPTLVIDADTTLIRARNWISSTGVQVLMPSEEFHKPYYDFLQSVGLYPNYNISFISHHMLYQPDMLRACLKHLGVTSTDELIKLVCSKQINTEQDSFFSIDYEMYGQFVYQNHPERVRLERWGNVDWLETSNKVLVEAFSISAHSWKTELQS